MLHVVSKLVPLPLYPVGLTLLLLTVAIVLLTLRRQRAALWCGGSAAVLLYLFSTPLVAWGLVRSLERHYDPQPYYPAASAIVLLGGGGVPPLPPRLYPETNWFGDRIMHAARLYHQGCAPYIIPSGGKSVFSGSHPTSEAANNAWLLTELLGVDSSVIILEEEAQNTYEHAPLLRGILERHALGDTVLVVTSAVHMYRSIRVFEKAGFAAIAAPADYHAHAAFQLKLINLLPVAWGVAQSTMALHEYYGLLAYRLLGWI